MKNGIFLAYISALINALIVGLSFLFTKTAVTMSTPLDTLSFRFSVAFLVLSFLLLIRVVKIKFRLREYYNLLPLTLFYPAAFFSFQAFGLKYVSSSEAGILFATIPIITAVFASIFLKEQTTVLQKLSIGLSVFGVIYIFVMKGTNISIDNWLGIALLVISCLSIAGYSILARSLTKSFKPMEITYFMLGVGFIFFNSVALFQHVANGSLDSMLTPWKDINFVFAILFLGILASFVTSLLSNFILSKIPASQMSVFSNLSTVVSIVAGAVILSEQIYYYHIIGSVLIIAGVIGTNLFKEKQLVLGKVTKAS